MNISQIDPEHLASRLEPILASILKEGGTFVEQLGTEFSKKASSGLVGTTINAVQSLGKAAWKTISSSRAHRRFQRRWDAASSQSERQLAIRQLLAEDPKRAQSLHDLLLRLDFLRAVAEHAEQLPNIGLLQATRRLSDVYVPLRIEALAERPPGSTQLSDKTRVEQASRSLELTAIDLLGSGNNIVEGTPGGGKSTLARWLTASIARNILDSSKTAFDKIRLPLLVSARSLQMAQSDFASALLLAATSEMSLTSLGALPGEFFLPYSEVGHKSWLIIIDGLDEIEDRGERQRLWDALSGLHSQAGDAFRFVIFTRPNAVRISSSASNFKRWRVCSPSESDRKLIARRYIDQERKAEEFIAQLSTTSLADVYQVPLFEIIAASLFSQTGALPTTHIGLCEAFISALIEKSSVSKLNRDSILRLLQLFAAKPDFDLSSDEVDFKSLIPQHTPRLQIKGRLQEIAQKTGLVQFSAGKLSFIHDIFRSYFLALQISRTHEPSSGVWKTVDPFRIGWTTSQYVCEIWSLADKDISSAVEALLSFGDNGETCAIEVSIACAAVSEKIITKIVDRIFREMYSTGMTMSGHSALTRLAAQRASVKGRLMEAVYSNRDFIAARLECAECLLGSGHLKEALNALTFIAGGEQEYHGDRIRAAELLLRNGQAKLASEVLHEMARDADELGMRADAASILFVNDQSEANRDLVAALLNEYPEDVFDTVYESTIGRLLSVGEENLALPLIRERAKPPSQASRLFDLPREEIAACRAIAAHHDRGEAVAALEKLLSWEHITLRGKAEVLEALADIGTEEIAKELLRRAIGKGPDYEGADWFVLKMLARLELEKELKAVGRYLLRHGLEKPSDGIEVSEIVARLVNSLDHEELAELIRPRLHVARDTRLVTCLATLGYRDEAIDLLKGWVAFRHYWAVRCGDRFVRRCAPSLNC